MSSTVIKVDNLSKQYRIGAKEGYKTFLKTLIDAAKAPNVRGDSRSSSNKKRIKSWASQKLQRFI